MLTFYIGAMLFGIGTLRTGTLARLGALLQMIWFPVGFVVGGMLQLVGVLELLAFSGLRGLLGAGWVVLWYALWSGAGQRSTRL